MEVIFEQRGLTPAVRALRSGSEIVLSVEYQTDGWLDEDLGYYLYDYGTGAVTFGGVTQTSSVGGDDDGWIYAAVAATLSPGVALAGQVFFMLDTVDPMGWTFDISVALLDVAGTLEGGAVIDALFGSTGDDRLAGRAGNDALEGGAGNDVLNGGRGQDNMVGGAGNDRYLVDDHGDRVDESGGSGRDLVRSAISFNLDGPQVSGAVERLQLTGSAAIDGIGSDRSNSIVGNGAANHLEGRGGADWLEGAGGADTLSGGRGADRFVFREAQPGQTDRILDFDWREDLIVLDDAGFAGIGTAGGGLFWLSFVANASGAATTAQTRIIYETDTGILSYDADGTGSGAAVAFARLTPQQPLGHADFLII